MQRKTKRPHFFQSNNNLSERSRGSIGHVDVVSVSQQDDDPRGRSKWQPFFYHRKSLSRTLKLLLSCGIVLLLLMIISRGNDADRNNDNGKNRIRKTASGGDRIERPLQPDHYAGLTSPVTNATIHIVFSTDCSSFQHWQSYLFFHSALKAQQPGYITRIASGCTDEELQYEKAWHEEHVRAKMGDQFHIHFTPKFSGLKDKGVGRSKGDYKYFNKPFGLKHFLEYNELMGFDESGNNMKHPDDIIILADPDFLLLRSLTDDFTIERSPQKIHTVSHGQPFAQWYFSETPRWLTLNLTAIAGPNSPALSIDQSTAASDYGAGPPYIATAKDMYSIAVTWADFAPKVHKQYPPSRTLFAEMYAYCIAAAHLGLPHTLIDNLGLRMAGRGWKFIKEIPGLKICESNATADNPQGTAAHLPWAVHYSQQYGVDKYSWGKRIIPHDIFTCQHQLLMEPPMDLGSGRYLSYVADGKPDSKPKKMPAEKAKMEAFMVCTLTKATNDAMTYFRTNHCGKDINMQKTYNLLAGNA